ncbi:unnamed protein product, partial [Symbiodinium microadriaticum]
NKSALCDLGAGLYNLLLLKTTLTDVDRKVATALLTYVTQAVLNAALAIRDGRLDAAEASIGTLQAAGFQTAAQVASAIATALLACTDTSGINALLAVKDGRLDAAESSLTRAPARWPAPSPRPCCPTSSRPARPQIGQRRGQHPGPAGRGALQRHRRCAGAAGGAGRWGRAERPRMGWADHYSTTAQMDAAIAAAVGGIDLSAYYTSSQTDATITAALVPVALSNAPAWGEPSDNVLRNLHFVGPLLASRQNNTDTLQIECDSYSKGETFTQAEVNSVVAGAIDALNVPQYRYFLQKARPGNVSLVRDNVTPPADGRYVQSGNLGSLDSRYFPVNGNNGGGGIFSMVITTLTPRMIRAILPRAPLSGTFILGNAGTLELNCDCHSKSESDGSYYTIGQSNANFADIAVEADVAALVTALEASPLPPDISVNSISATGDWLSLVGGTAGTRIRDSSNADLITVTSSEAFFGVRSRVDYRLTIDTSSEPDEAVFPTRLSTPLQVEEDEEPEQDAFRHQSSCSWTLGFAQLEVVSPALSRLRRGAAEALRSKRRRDEGPHFQDPCNDRDSGYFGFATTKHLAFGRGWLSKPLPLCQKTLPPAISRSKLHSDCDWVAPVKKHILMKRLSSPPEASRKTLLRAFLDRGPSWLPLRLAGEVPVRDTLLFVHTFRRRLHVCVLFLFTARLLFLERLYSLQSGKTKRWATLPLASRMSLPAQKSSSKTGSACSCAWLYACGVTGTTKGRRAADARLQPSHGCPPRVCGACTLEAFSGTGSVGRAVELGWAVVSLDLDPKSEATICADVCGNSCPGLLRAIDMICLGTTKTSAQKRRPQQRLLSLQRALLHVLVQLDIPQL